jgi:hypothetical protein
VVAPVKADGVVQYEVWQPGTEVELDVLLAKQSPKEWVFPAVRDLSEVQVPDGGAGRRRRGRRRSRERGRRRH